MISNDLIYRIAYYIVDNNATIRQTAKVFYRSKTSVHRLMKHNLRQLDFELYLLVKNVARYNLSQRAIRGGESTKRKYKTKRDKLVMQ